MSALLERAKAHYAALPRHELRVPEWGISPQEPAVITWTDLTVRDQERIYAADADGRPASGGVIRLRAVICKACDDSGKLLFDGMSEHYLRHSVSGDVVGRIANAILFSGHLVDKTGATNGVDEQIDAGKNG